MNRPNILFILMDDLGWKDLGCCGSTYYETPNLDRLAAQGLRFTNAYSTSPVCSPSRGAIVTGKNPARTQFTTVVGQAITDDALHEVSKFRGGENKVLEARHRHALPTTETTFAEKLRDAGYATGFFGKWHCGAADGYYPSDRGFEVAKGYRTYHQPTRGHWVESFEGSLARLPHARPGAYISDVLTDECIEFITENRERPVLAFLSHYLVHKPLQAKPELLEKYKDKPTTDQANPVYAAMVQSMDESVGRVMQVLDDLGLADDTVVVFTSDNGGLTLDATSNYPLMGGKSFPYEAGMRVPFIVRWPDRVNPGTLSQTRLLGTDLYPTFLALAGVDDDAYCGDGLDLGPVFQGRGELPPRNLLFHFPHYTHATGPFTALTGADGWKLIHFYNDEAGGFQLFDLNVDEEEQNDLSAEHPEKIRAMAETMRVMLKEMKAELPSPNPDFDPKAEGRKNLAFTRSLALRERAVFAERLGLRP